MRIWTVGVPWRWQFMFETGPGTSADPCGMDSVFTPYDFCSSPDVNCMFIILLHLTNVSHIFIMNKTAFYFCPQVRQNGEYLFPLCWYMHNVYRYTLPHMYFNLLFILTSRIADNVIRVLLLQIRIDATITLSSKKNRRIVETFLTVYSRLIDTSNWYWLDIWLR